MHQTMCSSPFLRCMAGKQPPLNFGTSLLFVADAFILAGSPSQSSLRDASSPKVGALGSPHKVHLFAKASPFGRGVTAGDGEGEDAALAQQNLFPRTAKSSPLRESWKSRQALTERGVQEKFSAVVTSQISVQ